MLVFVTLCLHVGYNSAAKRLSLDIGGSKRLHALSTLVSVVLLAPWAAFVSLTRQVIWIASRYLLHIFQH